MAAIASAIESSSSASRLGIEPHTFASTKYSLEEDESRRTQPQHPFLLSFPLSSQQTTPNNRVHTALVSHVPTSSRVTSSQTVATRDRTETHAADMSQATPTVMPLHKTNVHVVETKSNSIDVGQENNKLGKECVRVNVCLLGGSESQERISFLNLLEFGHIPTVSPALFPTLNTMRLRVKQDATECSRNIMFEIVDISTIAASHQTKLLMPLLKQADLLVVLVNELHQMELEQSFQLCHRLVPLTPDKVIRICLVSSVSTLSLSSPPSTTLSSKSPPPFENPSIAYTSLSRSTSDEKMTSSPTAVIQKRQQSATTTKTIGLDHDSHSPLSILKSLRPERNPYNRGGKQDKDQEDVKLGNGIGEIKRSITAAPYVFSDMIWVKPNITVALDCKTPKKQQQQQQCSVLRALVNHVRCR